MTKGLVAALIVALGIGVTAQKGQPEGNAPTPPKAGAPAPHPPTIFRPPKHKPLTAKPKPAPPQGDTPAVRR
jgi:hypothetical protein